MRNITHKIFLVSLVLKAVNGFFELLGGFMFLFLRSHYISGFLLMLMHGELGEDPNDPFVAQMLYAADHLSVSTRTFLAFYLLAHGVINIALVTALSKKIHIAYPIATGFFLAFMLYELFRFILHPSLWLAGLLCVDAVVIYSIIKEYRKVLHLKKSESLFV